VERASRLPCRHSCRHSSQNIGKDAGVATRIGHTISAALRYCLTVINPSIGDVNPVVNATTLMSPSSTAVGTVTLIW